MGASLEWSVRTRRQEQRFPLRGAACVIEPNDLARALLADALRAMGFTTHETASGAVGAFMAGQVHPQVVLVNVALPDANGLDLIRRFRAASTRAAIIALTPEGRFGFGDVLARFAGADFSVPEDASAEALSAAVLEVTGHPPLHAERV